MFINTDTILDREKKVLEFWDKNNTFKKSANGADPVDFIDKIKDKIFERKEFVFYDGPPFATGSPHYGHILASSVKDAIPRYKTMRGYKMDRTWGWDCHGLPLEVEIEKELGIKNKQEIEEYGIENFNKKARAAVLRYADEWKKIIPRIGRWVNMENDYKTMNTSYTESVWNVFARLHKRGYVYEGFKSLHLCPRCSTTLSNNEVSEGYAEIEDVSVYITFPLKTEKAEIIIWTTTPWTLFGNVACAVNEKEKYVYINDNGRTFIVHKDAKERLFENSEIIKEIYGKELIGLEYAPLFTNLYKGDEKGIWKIYNADYVNGESGTGIVHLAPAYGAEDMELASKNGLPIKHHVKENGEFIDELGEFAGLLVKTKGNDKTVDNKIIEKISSIGRLFKAENITHSYPLCWRCDTPLLNYATTSWFIDVPSFKNKMIKQNRLINWIPRHLKYGRFGKWIENSPAWVVSRSRYWGAPLPIWQNKETGKILVIDSIPTLKSYLKKNNTYYFVRHGESQSVAKRYFSCLLDEKNDLTQKGIDQANETRVKIEKINPDVIITSPLTRTKQTAEILSKNLKITPIENKKLIEIQEPELHNEKIEVITEKINILIKNIDRVDMKLTPKGESWRDVYKRIYELLEELEQKYKGKTIILVSHRSPIEIGAEVAKGVYFRVYRSKHYLKYSIPPGSILKIDYDSFIRNDKCNIDLHRPFIDKIVLQDKDGLLYNHCKLVFDCWFESGAMPYASKRYPFSYINKFDPVKQIGFPADFICEAVDQTRGWFYSLLAIGVGAYDSTPYKNVITTGLVRAKDGKKMSKKLKNYTNPIELIEKYGADSLRYYLFSSPITTGQDIDFDDKMVAEISRKVYGRLNNVLSFYLLYKNKIIKKGTKNLLDIYIINRLHQVRNKMTDSLESYLLDEATKPIGDFIDDLSTWYLRRSREILKSDTKDGEHARYTLHFVLVELSKLIAPISPFYAEYLYQSLDNRNEMSVHLCRWPNRNNVNLKLVERMELIKKIVSMAHEEREKIHIKTRQPLQTLYIEELLTIEERKIISEEVNVKEVISANEFSLDITITKELKQEGLAREVLRAIQGERKNNKFKIEDVIKTLEIECSKEIEEAMGVHKNFIANSANVKEIVYKENNGVVIKINKEEIKITIN